MNTAWVNDLEVVRAALELERAAYVFYARMAATTKSRSLRELFHMLAVQEEHHRHAFEKFEEQLLETPTWNWEDDEARDYVRAILDQLIFPEDPLLLAALTSAEDILHFTCRLEKDIVLFYDAVSRNASTSETRALFSRIAEEERRHVVWVSQALPSPHTPEHSVLNEDVRR